jgi:hypothetical protein
MRNDLVHDMMRLRSADGPYAEIAKDLVDKNVALADAGQVAWTRTFLCFASVESGKLLRSG